MNYRHAFHAGNHADVLKHVVVLALCEALAAKPAPCFALDTHGGRGLYKLDGEAAQTTGEAQDGIARLQAQAPRDPALQRYLAAVRAGRAQHGAQAEPGAPRRRAHARRAGARRAPGE
ncbi:MAG: 23S rRNA (adenine(2030)-N(6))-methyltransferase RlmJ, partial [Thermomonas sp.]